MVLSLAITLRLLATSSSHTNGRAMRVTVAAESVSEVRAALAELDTVDQVGAVAADETIDAGETTATGAMVAFDVELVSSDAADAVRRVVTDISPGATALTIAEEFTDVETAKKTGRLAFGRMLTFLRRRTADRPATREPS